jgi:hypothetical protein
MFVAVERAAVRARFAASMRKNSRRRKPDADFSGRFARRFTDVAQNQPELQASFLHLRQSVCITAAQPGVRPCARFD